MTELAPNPGALARSGGRWRGLDDLEIATCARVSWCYEERLHGELDDLTPIEVEDASYRHSLRPPRAEQPSDGGSRDPRRFGRSPVRATVARAGAGADGAGG